MENKSPEPAAAPSAAPTPSGTAISEAQVRDAMAAAFEVLNGAPSSRILELADKIVLAKLLARDVAAGTLAIVRPPAPMPSAATPGPAPANRQQRRATEAAARRK